MPDEEGVPFEAQIGLFAQSVRPRVNVYWAQSLFFSGRIPFRVTDSPFIFS